MTRQQNKRRRELQKLIKLKEDVMSAEIAGLQAQENALQKKVSFQETVYKAWADTGGFKQAERASRTAFHTQIEIEEIQTKKKNAQREKLMLKIAKTALSKN